MRRACCGGLLVCPDQELYQSFKAAVHQVPTIQIADEALEYFDPRRLSEMVDELRADSVVIDLATDTPTAMGLVERCSDQLRHVSIAGIHRTNDPETIFNCLREWRVGVPA